MDYKRGLFFGYLEGMSCMNNWLKMLEASDFEDLFFPSQRGQTRQSFKAGPSWAKRRSVQGRKKNLVTALNESIAGSVKSVFKAWDHRLENSEGFLASNEGDPELLVFIPFTSDVKIKSISVIGGANGTSPSKMRSFINREGIDFSDAQNMQPVQEWELAENLQGMLEYQTRYSKFQSVGNLTLHFPENFGSNEAHIHYIGLRGEATQLKRDAVTTVVYELYPNPSEHKTNSDIGGVSHVE